ncbi:MAG: ComEC family competence protein [Bacteroidaceae bacterium]|nr:ComEC family competence protein [Bacteroidaceae bacterium]
MKLSDWPSLRLVIPLIAGIYISDTIENTRAEVPVWCLIAATVLIALVSLIFIDRLPRISGFCLSFSFVLIGATSYLIQMHRVRVEWPSRYAVYHGVVNSYPLERDRSYRVEVTLKDTLCGGHNIYLYLPKDSVAPTLEPGYVVEFDGKINKPSSQGAGFDYESYLLSHGISGTLRVQSKDWKSFPPDGTEGLRIRAIRFRRAVIHKYQEWGLSGNALAVASAVSLGEKRALSDDLREVYSTSGVSHVLAVSGLHVGIMCWFLYLIFPAFFFRRAEWLRQFLVMVILWAYAYAIGLPVSITRTLIMFSIVAICRALERETSALNSLGIAAIIMLAAHPSSLFDMSFQLSFSAVFFIVLLTPILLEIYEPRNPIGRYIWRVMVLSFSAQVGTVPIVMYHFSGFSTYVMLANLFVVPVMFVVVSLSMSLWIAGWFPMIRGVLVAALTWLIDIMTSLLTLIAGLPYAQIELSLHRGWVIFVMYTVVILACLWYREKRSRRLVQALACIAAASILAAVQNFVI